MTLFFLASIRNERGQVFVFLTLMIVILLVMVGMGLDSGWLTFNRSQGQRSVDAGALAGATAVRTGNATLVKDRIEEIASKSTTNDYVGLPTNLIDGTVNGPNVTLVKYDPATNNITNVNNISDANGVRVALETKNPYTGASPDRAISTPVFLTPLLNLLGASASATADVSVSAVAIARAIPAMPIVLSGCPGINAPNHWDPPTCESIGEFPPESGIYKGTKCELFRHPSPGDWQGWTTYSDSSVSASDVRERLRGAEQCAGVDGADIGSPICVNNGNIPNLLNEMQKLYDGHNGYPLFSGVSNSPESEHCFLVPVIDQAITQLNQCHPMKSYAHLCVRDVELKNPFRLYADITCPVDVYTTTLAECYLPRLVRDTKSGM